MFVRKAKYDEAKQKSERLETDNKVLRAKMNNLVTDYNNLIIWIRNRGGLEAIDSKMSKATFSPDEIKALIRLCHPDKHNGSTVANVITTKLLQMRK